MPSHDPPQPEQHSTQQHTYKLSDGDRFILFGDSILQQSFSPHLTFPFGAALSDAYTRKFDISNRGFSGYNTLQALRALSLCLPNPNKANMRILFIMFGANDARLPNTPGGPDQHVPLEDFKSNIRHMVSHPSVTAHESVKIILVTPPPVDERKCLAADQEKLPTIDNNNGSHQQHPLRRTAATTATYAQALRSLGPELNIPILDIHRAMLALSGHSHLNTPPTSPPYLLPGSLEAPQNPTLQSFLSDGLHFTGEGYRLLFTELMLLIEREWPELMPGNLPLRLPAWDFQPAWKNDGGGGAGGGRDGNGAGGNGGGYGRGHEILEWDMITNSGEKDAGWGEVYVLMMVNERGRRWFMRIALPYVDRLGWLTWGG
ncbi:hypothetical protein LTR56_026803 [Elasticomyces elasticus]|nr:hypothetical protein LTR56_026803 [Elasticomyces elasticus]